MKKIIITIIFALIPFTASATSFYFSPNVVSQVRENALSERETIFDSYLDAGIAEMAYNGSLDVSLKNNRTFNIDEDEFDLYQAVFRMKGIGGVFDFSAGRQFFSPAIDAYLIDGLTTRVGKSDWPLIMSLFGGIPRYIETGDFHGATGLVTGAALELNGFDATRARLTATYDKLDIKTNDWRANETVLVGLYASHQFGGRSMPTFYGASEYDTAGRIFDTSTLGLGIEPHERLYLNLEGGYYNKNSERSRPSVFALFAGGPMYQGRTAMRFTIIENNDVIEEMSLTGGYSYQRLKVASNNSKNGHAADGGIILGIVPLRLVSNIFYRYSTSFGGNAHDVGVVLHDEPFEIVFLDAGTNYTKYSKITNDNDTAISAFLTGGIQMLGDLTLSVGGEYLNNNVFKNDWRITTGLSYRLEGAL